MATISHCEVTAHKATITLIEGKSKQTLQVDGDCGCGEIHRLILKSGLNLIQDNYVLFANKQKILFGNKIYELPSALADGKANKKMSDF